MGWRSIREAQAQAHVTRTMLHQFTNRSSGSFTMRQAMTYQHILNRHVETQIHGYAHICPYLGLGFSLNYLIATCMAAVYCFLLSAPSFCMPSQPTRFPAFSSMPPMPCWLGSRFADAAFIASTACDLSCAPDAFHASAPVTFPMVSC